MKYYRFVLPLLAFAGVLSAQTEADAVLNQTRNMPSGAAHATQKVFSGRPAASTTLPPVVNVLTVLGDNVDDSGVPCFACVSGALGNTIGLVAPDTSVHADGVTSYAFDNYLFDNSYNGSCSYTFLVRDSTSKYVVKLGPFVFTEGAGGASLTSTAYSIPTTAAAGVGAAVTLVQCGATNTISSMPLFINVP